MEQVKIYEVYAEIEHKSKNQYTGEWIYTYSQGKLRGYEVIGGWFGVTFHKTLKSAEKEAEVRISINKKFPFSCLASQREIEKSKVLGL